MEQTPCPHRIVDDAGSAFAMGAIGGSVWHGVKGLKNSPKGMRFRGSMEAVVLRAPTLGGNFAVWGGLFSMFDCGYAGLRNRHDPWNSIMAGASTGGLLACRAGWKVMLKNAAVGGVLLGLIEGLGVIMQKMLTPQPPTLQPPMPLSAPPRSLQPSVFAASEEPIPALSDELGESLLDDKSFQGYDFADDNDLLGEE
eukprot:g2604.t1